jgi:hypothetical protein
VNCKTDKQSSAGMLRSRRAQLTCCVENEKVHRYLFSAFAFVEIILLYAVCGLVSEDHAGKGITHFGSRKLVSDTADPASSLSQPRPFSMVNIKDGGDNV